MSRFTFQYEIAEGDCVGERKYWGTGMKSDDTKNENENKNKNDKSGMREINVNKNIEKIRVENDRKRIEVVEEGGAIRMARAIREEGMLCGVCITPHTDINVLDQLLNTEYCTETGHVRYTQTVQNAHNEIPSSSSASTIPSSTSSTPSNPSRTLWTPLIDYVDLLAVNPGIGGQEFNHDVLEKVLHNFHFIA